MIDSVIPLLRFLGAYALCAALAYLVHLGMGVRAVGLEEVRQQEREGREQLGWMYVVFILTAGIYPDDFEISEPVPQCTNCGHQYDDEPPYCSLCGNAEFEVVRS